MTIACYVGVTKAARIRNNGCFEAEVSATFGTGVEAVLIKGCAILWVRETEVGGCCVNQ